MQVIWTPQAERDRSAIWEFVAKDSPNAAIGLDQIFSDAASQLSQHPMMGRVGRVAGTRELIPHPSYRLIYEISEEEVWVLALVHMARQWPVPGGG